MLIKPAKKIFVFLLIATIFLNGSFFVPTVQAQTTQLITLNAYLSYFYNRYSKHLDKYGLVYKAPGYGVPHFRPAQTAREILSLATYYKYRALAGEPRARRILRAAILNARHELNSRSEETYSFSDAWAQMDMLALTKQLPDLLTPAETKQLYAEILNRAPAGIAAPDSSNRAALSAVYWQQIIDYLFKQGWLAAEDKHNYDRLIYQKISQVMATDVTPDGWYLEGRPLQFNPHYHMVTATALLAYAKLTNDIQAYVLAKKMTANLRSVSFQNGMVEARLGQRPVGLGAQFYLGAGILSYAFDWPDYAAYFNYANGDRFFSDARHPNRLEYHSTIYNSRPNYHDDISFSNLAELILLTPSLAKLAINPAIVQLGTASQTVTYHNLTVRQINDDFTSIIKTNQLTSLNSQQPGQPLLNIANTYGRPRLSLDLENKRASEFLRQVENYHLSPSARNILGAAYIYGGYSLAEIIDTILNGPRAVHPVIPAMVWRQTANYQKYLHSLARTN